MTSVHHVPVRACAISSYRTMEHVWCVPNSEHAHNGPIWYKGSFHGCGRGELVGKARGQQNQDRSRNWQTTGPKTPVQLRLTTTCSRRTQNGLVPGLERRREFRAKRCIIFLHSRCSAFFLVSRCLNDRMCYWLLFLLMSFLFGRPGINT